MREQRIHEFGLACRAVGLQILVVKGRGDVKRFQFYPVSANNIRSRAPIHIATGSRSAVAFFHGWVAARTIVLAAMKRDKSKAVIMALLGAPVEQGRKED